MENSTTLNEVSALAGRLSPIDKVRLIEWVAPQIERDWPAQTDRAADRPLTDVAPPLSDYVAVLADSDHVRGQIEQWQRQAAVQLEDTQEHSCRNQSATPSHTPSVQANPRGVVSGRRSAS